MNVATQVLLAHVRIVDDAYKPWRAKKKCQQLNYKHPLK